MSEFVESTESEHERSVIIERRGPSISFSIEISSQVLSIRESADPLLTCDQTDISNHTTSFAVDLFNPRACPDYPSLVTIRMLLRVEFANTEAGCKLHNRRMIRFNSATFSTMEFHRNSSVELAGRASYPFNRINRASPRHLDYKIRRGTPPSNNSVIPVDM